MRKNLTSLAIVIVLVLAIFTPLMHFGKATVWTTANNDYDLTNANAWTNQTWDACGTQHGDGYSGLPYQNSIGWVERDNRGHGCWGNEEFVQGSKPIWDNTSLGQAFTPIRLTSAIKLQVRAALNYQTSSDTANAYINLWCHFPTTVGTSHLSNLEIIVYIGAYGPNTECAAGDYSIRTTDDGNGNVWYFDAFRADTNLDNSWSNYYFNIDAIIMKAANHYSITYADLANGAIYGLTFGVECKEAYICALYDYVKLETAPDPPVTIRAYDESSSSYISGIPIKVDNEWIASEDIDDVTNATHTFQAPDADGGGAFDCFYDGTNYYSNLADIPITEATTVTAYYYYIPTYTLDLYAIDYQYWIPLYPSFYIDGNYIGTAPCSIEVTPGWHSIAADDQVWNDQIQAYDTIWFIGHGDYYNNGDPVLITSSGNAAAVYTPPFFLKDDNQTLLEL